MHRGCTPAPERCARRACVSCRISVSAIVFEPNGSDLAALDCLNLLFAVLIISRGITRAIWAHVRIASPRSRPNGIACGERVCYWSVRPSIFLFCSRAGCCGKTWQELSFDCRAVLLCPRYPRIKPKVTLCPRSWTQRFSGREALPE